MFKCTTRTGRTCKAMLFVQVLTPSIPAEFMAHLLCLNTTSFPAIVVAHRAALFRQKHQANRCKNEKQHDVAPTLIARREDV
jgi:hypothetical protein